MTLNQLLNKLPLGKQGRRYKSFWERTHIDFILLFLIFLLISFGLFILHSASDGQADLLKKQILWFSLAFIMMLGMAQVSPARYFKLAPWLYAAGVCLLAVVLIIGHIGKGAQRWLNLGFFHFQPSEFMKIAIPLFIGWYFHHKHLPPSLKDLGVCGAAILIPVLLTAKQPDLGTALMLAMVSGSVMILAGMSWRLLIALGSIAAFLAPVLWYFMHDYQRGRVLTFLNPERDPLGSGYHIIQSKIAIGSGGFWGKGWQLGTQSHLNFLPEHATDFIFAVCGEELGFIGGLICLMLFMAVTARCFYIAFHAHNTFSRLLAGGLTMNFFLSMFVNMGMVIGLLPVVGVPLPLISYGGTSMVTLMLSFGILMSIHTQGNLIKT